VGTSGWDLDFGVTGPETTDDREITRRAVDFLGTRRMPERPFALFVSYNHPHDICRFGRKQDLEPRGNIPLPASWHAKDLSTTPSPQREFMRGSRGRFMDTCGEQAWQRYREFYREQVGLFDREAGEVLDCIRQLGIFENSLIAITSDHGDMDGNHRLVVKGPFLYEHLVRVPLLVKPPASCPAPVPRTETCMTINTDLAPTLAEFAGTKLTESDGMSLKPLLCGQPLDNPRKEVFLQYYSKQQWVNPIRGIRTRHYKYNRYQLHGEELYDLVRDPGEIHNLAGNPDFADIQAGLARRLEKWMQENSDPFPGQVPTTPDGGPLAPRERRSARRE
jgi:arylsulfatase